MYKQEIFDFIRRTIDGANHSDYGLADHNARKIVEHLFDNFNLTPKHSIEPVKLNKEDLSELRTAISTTGFYKGFDVRSLQKEDIYGAEIHFSKERDPLEDADEFLSGIDTLLLNGGTTEQAVEKILMVLSLIMEHLDIQREKL